MCSHRAIEVQYCTVTLSEIPLFCEHHGARCSVLGPLCSVFRARCLVLDPLHSVLCAWSCVLCPLCSRLCARSYLDPLCSVLAALCSVLHAPRVLQAFSRAVFQYVPVVIQPYSSVLQNSAPQYRGTVLYRRIPEPPCKDTFLWVWMTGMVEVGFSMSFSGLGKSTIVQAKTIGCGGSRGRNCRMAEPYRMAEISVIWLCHMALLYHMA